MIIDITLPKGWWFEHKWTHTRDKFKPRSEMPVYLAGRVNGIKFSVYIGKEGNPKAAQRVSDVLEKYGNRGPRKRTLSWELWENKRFAVFARDKFTCRYCGTMSRIGLDHIVPRKKGGTDDLENLVTSCIKCNSIKGAMSYDQFVVHVKEKHNKTVLPLLPKR